MYGDLPDGTWIASFWVEDETYFNEVIMSGEFKGFSVEINVSMQTEEEIKDDMLSRCELIYNDTTISVEEKKAKIISILNLDK